MGLAWDGNGVSQCAVARADDGEAKFNLGNQLATLGEVEQA